MVVTPSPLRFRKSLTPPRIKSEGVPCEQGETSKPKGLDWDRVLRSQELFSKSLTQHKYGCLMAVLPEPLREEIAAWSLGNLHDEHLAPDGRDPTPHTTILYGFRDSSPVTVDALKALLTRHGPITLTLLDGLSTFPAGKDGVPLKIDVRSEQLHDLNATIRGSFDCEVKFPDYHPHVTLGYLLPEAANVYADEKPPFLNRLAVIDTVEWSGADGVKELIPLSFLPLFGSESADGIPSNEFATKGFTQGDRVEITDGEYAGYTGAVYGIPIPQHAGIGTPRSRLGELQIRVQIDGFPKPGGWNGQVAVRESWLRKKAMSAFTETGGGALVSPPQQDSQRDLSWENEPKPPEEKPANCTCPNYPTEKIRNGSGHQFDCPVHVAWLARGGFQQMKSLRQKYRVKSQDDPLQTLTTAIGKFTAEELDGIEIYFNTDSPHMVIIDIMDWGEESTGKRIGSVAAKIVGDETNVIYHNEGAKPRGNWVRVEVKGRKTSPFYRRKTLTPPCVKGSYFAECERDERGNCLPMNEAGRRKQPDATSQQRPTANPNAQQQIRSHVVREALKAAGGKILSTRDAATSLAKRLGDDAWSKLSEASQRKLTAAWKVVRGVEHYAMLGFTKAKEMAKQVALERGLQPERIDKLGRILAATDLVLAWTVNMPTTLAVTGSFSAAKVSSWIPVASLAYIAYSTARNPWAVSEAARKVIRGQTATEHKGLDPDLDDIAGELADRLRDAPDPDWFAALYSAALDQTGVPALALELVSAAAAGGASGGKHLWSYQTKGEGEPCEQGETAVHSGCIPADGDAKKKPSKSKKEGSGNTEALKFANQIRTKLVNGESISPEEMQTFANTLTQLGTQELGALWMDVKKKLIHDKHGTYGMAKAKYVDALVAHAKQMVQEGKQPGTIPAHVEPPTELTQVESPKTPLGDGHEEKPNKVTDSDPTPMTPLGTQFGVDPAEMSSTQDYVDSVVEAWLDANDFDVTDDAKMKLAVSAVIEYEAWAEAHKPQQTEGDGFDGNFEVVEDGESNDPPTDTSEFPVEPTDLKVVKKLGGTTGALLVEDEHGNRFVRKKGLSPEHIKEEFTADRMYEALGISTPVGKLYDTAGGPVKLTGYIPNTVPLGQYPGDKKAIYQKLREGFVADALLGNWDVIGASFDNILVSGSGEILRVDNGGALRFRAQGKKKTNAQFGEAVTEIETLLDPYKNPQASTVFKGIAPEDIAKQVQAIDAKREALLAAIPDKALRTKIGKRLDWLKEHHGTVPQKQKTEADHTSSSAPAKKYAPNSIYAGVAKDWPSTPPDPKNTYAPPAEEHDHVIFKDYGDEDARKPISKYADSFFKHMTATLASLKPHELSNVKNYTSTSYAGLNKKMRLCPETLDCLDPKKKKMADKIDAAIAKAGKFERPVTVWRNSGIEMNSQAGKDFLAVLQYGLETGEDVRIPGLKSTSMSPDKYIGGGDVKLEIRAKSGLWVEGVSYHSGEKELLQGHNVRYRVVGIKDVKSFAPGSDFGLAKTIVQLEEI